MSLFLSYSALIFGLILSAFVIRMAIRLHHVDEIESMKSASRASSLKDAFFGRTRIEDGRLPDARVKGGMVFNKKEERLEISGRLSDEGFKHIFR